MEEFDELLGHAVTVTNTASSVFTAEMTAAYPVAMVVLKIRNDLDAWHESAIKIFVGISKNWEFWFVTWWGVDILWAWHLYN